ncbi:MAG: metal-dependent hydrolase [Pseudomonadaceae bacterium]|nr:metal-dependent hydrolase [Pseudomonadaceae bacterium]
MDPITQGALGATFSQSAAAANLVAERPDESRRRFGAIALLGLLSGMAPDLDIFILSTTDPLLSLEYHRHFTHALAFIPIGALICAGVMFAAVRRRLSFAQTYLACLFGYASHGLLDACTTYGTQLLWPFSDVRIAWNNVSVVDPFFTVPVVALAVFAWRRSKPRYALFGLGWALLYLAFGLFQNQRAVDAALDLAADRGHAIVRADIGAKPAFASLLVFKTIYEVDRRFYVDAVRTGLATRVYEGDSIDRLDVTRDLPWLIEDSQQARDLERFRWFSNDHLALHPENQYLVIDIRYSMVPNKLDPLWGIELNPAASNDAHIVWRPMRADGSQRLGDLWHIWMNR